jgi:HlyD family secretion protein
MSVHANVTPAKVLREAALRRLSSPQPLTHPLSVASPSDWLVMMAVLLLLGGTAIWSWTGTITRIATGQGILLGAGGVVSVDAPGSGHVVSVAVKPGDVVRTGQLIASIGNPVLAEQVRLAEMALADAEREAARTSALVSERAGLQLRATETHRETLTQEIADLEPQTLFAAEQVEGQQKLYADGIVIKSAVIAAQERLAAIRADISRRHTEIERLRAERAAVRTDFARAESERREHVAELARGLAALREELRQTTLALAPSAGRVIETKIYPGAMVTAGTSLVAIQPDGGPFEALIYISSQQAKSVTAGMDVQLSPGNTRPEEHGHLRATVQDVASFPVSPLAVTRRLENESLTSAITGNGPVTEIRVALRSDPGDVSGYEWSSRRGAHATLSAGTLCTARIVVATQRPLALAIPALKAALGLN